MGRPFTAYTDHRTLIHLETQRDISGRKARWALTLQEFDVQVVYREGTKNIVADALSRRVDLRLRSIVLARPAYRTEWPVLYPECPDFGDIYKHLRDPANNPEPKNPKYAIDRFDIVDDLLYYEQDHLCVPRVEGV
jgi:hypothetical protein